MEVLEKPSLREATAFWFLDPGHWESVRAMLSRPRPTGAAEPLDQRPAFDIWGDPISQMTMDQGVAVIPVNGALMKGATGFDKRQGVAAYEDVHEDLNAAQAAGAKAIVLAINSPGGTAVGARGLAEHVASVAEKTTIVSYTEDMQCSAAEYLSGACSARFATPDAIVGSIGTIMSSISFEGMLNKFGVKASVFTSGKFKGAGHPFKDLTPEQSIYLQSFVDALASEFKTHMQTHRPGITDSMMQGQIFTGKQAASNGLIDGTVSSLEQVLSLLR